MFDELETPPASADDDAVADPAPVLDYASFGERVGAAALELLLFGAGLVVGWVVWWVVLWRQGQTPAKSVLQLRIVRADDGTPASFARTAARELLGKALAPLALVTAAVALVDKDRRSLWDHAAGVAVVRDRQPVVVGSDPR